MNALSPRVRIARALGGLVVLVALAIALPIDGWVVCRREARAI